MCMDRTYGCVFWIRYTKIRLKYERTNASYEWYKYRWRLSFCHMIFHRFFDIGISIFSIQKLGFPTPFLFAPFQLVFEGVVGMKGFGDYAIDDIQVVNGLCALEGHCDFEGK